MLVMLTSNEGRHYIVNTDHVFLIEQYSSLSGSLCRLSIGDPENDRWIDVGGTINELADKLADPLLRVGEIER